MLHYDLMWKLQDDDNSQVDVVEWSDDKYLDQDHLLNKLQDDLVQNMLALLEEEANSAPAILKVSESYSALDFSLTCFRLTGIAQKQSSWNKRRRHWNSFVHNYVVNIYSKKQTTWRELIHTLKWKKRPKRCTLHLKEDPASYKCC